MLSCVEHEKSFITSGPDYLHCLLRCFYIVFIGFGKQINCWYCDLDAVQFYFGDINHNAVAFLGN